MKNIHQHFENFRRNYPDTEPDLTALENVVSERIQELYEDIQDLKSEIESEQWFRDNAWTRR